MVERVWGDFGREWYVLSWLEFFFLVCNVFVYEDESWRIGCCVSKSREMIDGVIRGVE